MYAEFFKLNIPYTPLILRPPMVELPTLDPFDVRALHFALDESVIHYPKITRPFCIYLPNYNAEPLVDFFAAKDLMNKVKFVQDINGDEPTGAQIYVFTRVTKATMGSLKGLNGLRRQAMVVVVGDKSVADDEVCFYKIAKCTCMLACPTLCGCDDLPAADANAVACGCQCFN